MAWTGGDYRRQMQKDADWYDDPSLEGRRRYWNGTSWTSHVAFPGSETYNEPFLGSHPRWQYGVVNIGMFKALSRLQGVLGHLGEQGWELVTIYDKSSNWFAEMEKGFMLLKRPVPPGVVLTEDEWCIAVSLER